LLSPRPILAVAYAQRACSFETQTDPRPRHKLDSSVETRVTRERRRRKTLSACKRACTVYLLFVIRIFVAVNRKKFDSRCIILVLSPPVVGDRSTLACNAGLSLSLSLSVLFVVGTLCALARWCIAGSSSYYCPL